MRRPHVLITGIELFVDGGMAQVEATVGSNMIVFFPSSQTTKVDVTIATCASLSQPTHGSGPCTRESCSAGLPTART